MNDFTNSSDNEDSLDIAAKDWHRIISTAKKTGYREGIENGSTDVFQEGFDKGYEEGFKTAFILGKFKSLLNVIPQNAKHPRNINDILNKTKRGTCHICVTESEHKDEIIQKPFSDIINEQKTHSNQVIRTLYQYFQPYVKDLNIDETNILDVENPVVEQSEDD